MNDNERKILIGAGALLIMLASAGLVAAGVAYALNMAGWIPACLIVSVICFWIGSAVAEVLKNNPEK